MKKADLLKCIEAGTDVAVAAHAISAGEVPRYAERAHVVAVGQKRRVYTNSRADFGGHIAEDGVRVAPINDGPFSRPHLGSAPIARMRGGLTYGDDHEETADRIVGPRDVYGTWADYARDLEASDLADAEKRGRKRVAEEECHRAVKAVNEALGRTAAAPHYRREGKYGHIHAGVTIDQAGIDVLLELLESVGSR